MADSSVEYNVVINGILPRKKVGDVAAAVAPILGILPDEALMLFNGVAHTVLQRADLSAAASFQARLKDVGIDASVAVAEDAAPPPAPEPAPEPAPAPAKPAARKQKPAPQQKQKTKQEAARQAAPSQKPAAEKPAADKPAGKSTPDSDVELDLSVLEAAQAARGEEEHVDPLEDVLKASNEGDEDTTESVGTLDTPEEEGLPDEELDLDAMFDDGDDAEEAAAPVRAGQPRAPVAPPLEMVEEADLDGTDDAVEIPAPVVETVVATAAEGAAMPHQDASPGSNMLCPSCLSLQPRAPVCPSCGATVAAAGAEATKKSKPKLPPRLERPSVIAATIAAAVGAGIWLGVAHSMDFDTGMFALLVGVLAGLACGLTGGRGAKAGGVSLALAAAGIIGAVAMLPKDTPQELPAPPQPNPAEVWSDAQAPQLYKQAVDDAEFFMTTDGSARAVRSFMIERNYTKARKPEQIPESDMRHFYDVDAKDLSWLVQNQPDFETWVSRMKGHLSGRQRVSLGVSAPPIEPVREGLTTMQMVYILLGVILAFVLGFIGLRRTDGK